MRIIIDSSAAPLDSSSNKLVAMAVVEEGKLLIFVGA
jgi:hypothetical protein